MRISRLAPLLALLALTAAACGPLSPPTTGRPTRPPSPAATAAPVVTITWSYWGDPWEVEINQRVQRAFEADHPQIRVNALHEPWSVYHDHLEAKWRAGESPDVMFIRGDFVRQYARQGWLEPLDAYMQRDGYNTSDFYPNLLRLFVVDGQYYGLPRDNDTKVIYFNKQLFDEAGVPYPRSGWTWADLRQAAGRLTKAGSSGEITQYGFAYESTLWWRLAVWQNGGDVVDDPLQPTRVLVDRPEAAEAVQLLADLTNVDRVTPPHGQLDSDTISQLFRQGKLAMAFGSHAQVPVFAEEQGLRWDVVGLPAGKRRANVVGGAAYTISPKSAHKDEAWALVRFLEGPKGQALFAESGVVTPARRSIREDSVFLRRQAYNSEIFSQETELGQPSLNFPGISEFNNLLETGLEPVWQGKESAATVLSRLRPQLQAIIDREASP